MKHFIKTVICMLILTAFITIKVFSQTVYVQETGKKYHTKNCSVAGNGKKGMIITEAKKGGYTACKVCKPEEPRTGEKTKTTAKPKEGDRSKAEEPKKESSVVQPK